MISWQTDQSSTSQVEYGATSAYGSSAESFGNEVTAHAITIHGLTPATTYHFRVRSANANGSTVSADATFATLGQPPAITAGSITARDVTSTSMTIVWVTDQGSTSQVDYGATNSYGSTTPLDSTAVTAHAVSISGLTPATLYYIRMRSTNANGSTAFETTFATQPPSPTITAGSIAARDVTATAATILWITEETSTSQVEYGLSSAYGSATAIDRSLTKDHAIRLSGLEPVTTYHFRVKSEIAGGTAVSGDGTLRTIATIPSTDVPAQPRTVALLVSPEIAAADTGGLVAQLATAIESDFRAAASTNDAAVSARIMPTTGDPIAVRALLRSIDHLWGAILIGDVASPWILEGQIVPSVTYAASPTRDTEQDARANDSTPALETYREEQVFEATDMERIAAQGRVVRQDFRLQPASIAYAASAGATRPFDAKPLDAPYKAPACPHFQIASDGRVTATSWNVPTTPECTHNVWISRIVGTTQQILGFIQRDLNTRHQGAPVKKYGYLRADWENGWTYPDMQPFWINNALYANSDVTYVGNYAVNDTAAGRAAIFRKWLADGMEMATISMHGAPELVEFEGYGISGVTYSPDMVMLAAGELASLPNHSRVLDLQSCSVGDYFFPDYIAGTALFGGDTLLVRASTVTLVSMIPLVELAQVQKKYIMLANGATFADIDMSPDDPLLMFGDPTIALRPKASTSGRPVLAVSTDGVNFQRLHGPWAALDVPFQADSVAGIKATQRVTLRNDGDASLAIQLTLNPDKMGIDNLFPDCTQGCGGMGFWVESPDALPGTQWGDLGAVVFTIAPRGTLDVNYSLMPMLQSPSNTKLYGNYNGRFSIFTVDPADHTKGFSDPTLGRLDLYFTGKVMP